MFIRRCPYCCERKDADEFACCKENHVEDVEVCDCSDCEDSDYPCTFDCGDCEGCKESQEEKRDIIFSIDQAQGRAYL